MGSPLLRCILCLLLSVCFSGCADIVERTKPPAPRPPIVEEDVSPTPEPPQNQGVLPEQQPTPQTEPLPQVGPNLPPSGDLGNRPPRRLPWKDRRESGA